MASSRRLALYYDAWIDRVAWKNIPSNSLCIWICFGGVIYISLLMTLKQSPPPPDLDISVIKHICETSPLFKPSCVCPKQAPFFDQSYLNKYQDVEPGSTGDLHKGKRHIAFIKTHKAASSTVLNMLYRFSMSNHLQVLLPKTGNYHGGRYLNKSYILPPENGKSYDVICNHAIFNYSSWKQFLPNDTIYIGIVREPFERFVSAFFYYRYVHPMRYIARIPGTHLKVLRTYLNNPLFYEPQSPMESYTNNRMVLDFGFPPSKFNDENGFNQFLAFLNKTLSLVLVAERFDESIVLMRRVLNWTTKDIIYTIKNRARVKPKLIGIERLKKNYRPFSHLDQKLYDFFKKRLHAQVSQQGPDFHLEVEQMKVIRKQINTFCKSHGKVEQLNINKTDWTDQIIISRKDCIFLTMEELQFLNYIRNRQTTLLRNFGFNAKVWNSFP